MSSIPLSKLERLTHIYVKRLKRLRTYIAGAKRRDIQLTEEMKNEIARISKTTKSLLSILRGIEENSEDVLALPAEEREKLTLLMFFIVEYIVREGREILGSDEAKRLEDMTSVLRILDTVERYARSILTISEIEQ